MSFRLNRRTLLSGSAAIAGVAALGRPALAQNAPVKIGVLTVKTGPLAAGGIHLESGITAFLKERDFTIAGRRATMVVGDTGGNPAGAKTKAIELVEREGVNLIIGPFAAFELLAVVDYLADKKMPTLAFAAAEDVTQRRANPYLVRTSYSSAQTLYPLADYAAKEMKAKRAITIGDDFAYGYEQVGGFQRAFEDAGGRVLKKLWAPLATPDYTPFIAQIQDCDLVCQVFAGSNPLRFTKQARELGVNQPMVGGSSVADDTIVAQFSDSAAGLVTSIPYGLDLPFPENQRFIAAMRKHVSATVPIGFYAAAAYVDGQIIEAALQRLGSGAISSDDLAKAIRAVSLANTPRGPISFDEYGNIVCDCYLRRVEKKDGKMVNVTFKTYPKVSQFWTYDPNWFLQQPVYSRDYPPLKT